MESASVTIRPATEDEAPIVGRLVELYAYDLSDAFAIDVAADGTFGYPTLASYWREPERRFPYLIYSEQRLAGFALVTRGTPATTDPADLDVTEFFVLRRLRQRGVGAKAAMSLWDHMPGHWIVRVADCNHQALPFWSSCIEAYTGGKFAQTQQPIGSRLWTVFGLDSR